MVESNINEHCEVVTFLSDNHINTFKNSYLRNLKLLGFESITVVAHEALFNQLTDLPGVHFIDEQSIISYSDLALVENRIKATNEGYTYRSKWYYQQFLKIAYALISSKEFYLYIESDLVLLNKLSLFENGEPIYNTRETVRGAYVRTIENLFTGTYWKYDFSFVVEYALINIIEMKSFINFLESLNSSKFYIEILKNINSDDIRAGFAEIDTYIHYREHFLSKKTYNIKKPYLRLGRRFLGAPPINDEILLWAKKDYLYLSIEPWDKTIKPYLRIASSSFIRRIISLKFIVEVDKSLLGFKERLYSIFKRL
jgi:hypothetical protein